VPQVAALVTGLILDRPLCLDCLATKSNTTPMAIERLLTTIGTAVRVRRASDRCRACGETKETVSIGRPE